MDDATEPQIPTTRLSEESTFYLDLTRYEKDQSSRAERDQTPRGRAIGFAMAMYQRRFASSMYAVRRSLESRRDKLKKQLENPSHLASMKRSLRRSKTFLKTKQMKERTRLRTPRYPQTAQARSN